MRMPELPEVESARKSLEKTITGKVIASVNVRSPAAVRTHGPGQFARALRGKQIIAVGRRGKTLLIEFRGGWVLVFHFKLWGIIRFFPDEAAPDSQTAVGIHFQDGSSLEFRELQLSAIGLHRTAQLGEIEYLATLGVEPLSREFTTMRLRGLLRGRGAVKSILTDQERIAGIGNLWAHEILHDARIRPAHRGDSLTTDDVGRLRRSVARVLREAIRYGGEPEFIDAQGRKGRYRLAVYGRGGQPCPRGDGTIRATRLGGRPSFFCPACQH